MKRLRTGIGTLLAVALLATALAGPALAQKSDAEIRAEITSLWATERNRVSRPEVTDEVILRFNDPAVKEIGVPGGGGWGRAVDLAAFHQALLHDGHRELTLPGEELPRCEAASAGGHGAALAVE